MSGFDEQFGNPPSDVRSIPFWAWNDRLDKEELLRQIDLMKEAGFGGFFMHARDGLESRYLGGEWDACVKACAEKARKLGMYAWMYDEDRWPSGFCGGAVQQEVGSLKGLTLEVADQGTAINGQVLAVWAATLSGEVLTSLRHFSENDVHTGEKLLIARLEGSASSPWFNGNPPPDNLDPHSEEAFIRLTHEHYAALFGASFPSLIRGTFTDEPSLCDRHASFNPHRGWIPWTTGFASWCEDKLGYDLLDVIPFLYFQGRLSSQVRHDYWRMVALRFEECYSAKIGAWCQQHGIISTGHFLQEEKMGLCARVNGYIMPHYTHETMPAIDLLTEQTDEYLTVKQCASVAHQFGKQGVLVETYAATGWEFSFEGQKWIGDWLYVLGVDHRCQHLMLSSVRGSRKRDYPPCFNDLDAWWPEYRTVEDYFARLSVILSRGQAVRHIAVVHPMSTVWCRLGCDPHGNPVRNNERDIPGLDAYGYRFNDLLRTLSRQHYDVDLLDETLLARYGSVNDGRLVLKNASYDVVIVPEIDSLYGTTVSLLMSFAGQKGKLIVTKPLPTMVEGRQAPEAFRFFGNLDVAENQDAIVSLLPARDVSVTEQGTECPAILYQLRMDGQQWYLFLVNNDREHAHVVDVTTSCVGSLTLLDPLTGEKRDMAVRQVGEGKMSWRVQADPCSSFVYLINRETAPRTEAWVPAVWSLVEKLGGQWNGRRDRDNVLTLDMCSWILPGKKPSAVMEVWKAQKQVREELGMRAIDSDEVVQRYQWIDKTNPKDGTPLSLSFRFVVSEPSRKPISLAVEGAALFSYRLDGLPIAAKTTGFYLNRAFQTVSLGKVGPGCHELVLSLPYRETTELEAVYLVGDFGVSPEREIISPAETYHLGDWTGQGLLHYPGCLTYTKTFVLGMTPSSLWLDVGLFKGACLRCSVNGKSFFIPWKAAGRFEVTEACRRGENEIAITLYSSPRNMLGPFHLKGGRRPFCNPGCFMPSDSEFDAGYDVFPYGLYGDVVLLQRSCS